jgi:hypothetical protein
VNSTILMSLATKGEAMSRDSYFTSIPFSSTSSNRQGPASTLLASSLFSPFSFRLSKHSKHQEDKGTGEGCKPSSLTRGSMLSENLVSGNDLKIPEPYPEQRKQDVKQAHFCLTHLTPIRSWISSVNLHPSMGLESACRRSVLATHNTPKH